MTTILYFFVFSSWGLGLLAALLALSMRLQEHSARMKSVNLALESSSLEMFTRKSILSRNITPPQNSIPEGLKDLINRSKGHPEVDEISPEDQIVGILFKAQSYPPDMEEDDDDTKQPTT